MAWVCGRVKERTHTQGRPCGERRGGTDVHPQHLAWCLAAQSVVALFQHVVKGPHLTLLCDVVPFEIPFALLCYPYGELLDIVWLVFLGVTISRKFQVLMS